MAWQASPTGSRVSLLKAVGCSVVRLAYDADASVNPKVAGGQLAFMRALKAEVYSIELERWDLADAKGIDDLLAAGKQAEVLTGTAAEEAIIEMARASGCKVEEMTPADEHEDSGPSTNGDGTKKPVALSGSSVLVNLIDGTALFHDDAGRAYGRVGVAGHVEVLSVRSQSFKGYLSHAYYNAQGSATSTQAMNEALGVIEAKARFDGPQREVFIRIGTDENRDHIYLDL